jgi:toxin ParE1/3/4
MNHSIILRKQAHQDIIESVIWYEGQRQGLGAEFYAEVSKIVVKVSVNPEMFEVKYRGHVRWAKTNRFPYIVVYIIENKTVVILGVISTYRSPKIWKKRI